MPGLLNRLNGARRLEESADAEINMAPLIDMIFILLIFFLVTASFVRESGLGIERPRAATAGPIDAAAFRISITTDGGIHIQKDLVDLRSVRGLVELYLIENPGGSVLIEADRHSTTGRLVMVLDQCRLAGADKIAVSTIGVGE